MEKNIKLSEARAAFIEKVGMALQAEGKSRIAGRLFGLLIFDGKPISFGDLAAELQVSRGSVSSNARFLEERGVIKRISKAGERQDYFQLADNPYATMIKGVAQRMQNAKNEINDTLKHLPSKAEGCSIDDLKKRLTDYSKFYEVMTINLMNASKSIED